MGKGKLSSLHFRLVLTDENEQSARHTFAIDEINA